MLVFHMQYMYCIYVQLVILICIYSGGTIAYIQCTYAAKCITHSSICWCGGLTSSKLLFVTSHRIQHKHIYTHTYKIYSKMWVDSDGGVPISFCARWLWLPALHNCTAHTHVYICLGMCVLYTRPLSVSVCVSNK